MKRGMQGKLVKCSIISESYNAFIPNDLPPTPEIDTMAISSLLEKANQAIGALNGVISTVPNSAIINYMYVRKEALLSSQIEGTQSTLDDLLKYEAHQTQGIPVADASEVSSYVAALNYGIERINAGFPLALRLVKEIHAILLKNSRGKTKLPGEFRSSQNWIGGTRPGNARFVPCPPDKLMEVLGQLEIFMNKDDNIPTLLKAAMIHVQFETIHPFLDGNGRIGRLLITLFLMEKKVLSTPALYISYFLKKNRIEYYDRMNEVRSKGNYEQWIKFFLEAVYESAKDAVETIDKLTSLHDNYCRKIKDLGRRAKNAMRVFEYLEANPIIEIQKTARELDIAFNTISSIVKDLIGIGVLEQTSTQSRNRTFVYKEYLDVLKEGT